MSSRLIRRLNTGLIACLVASTTSLFAADVCLMEEAPFLAKSQPIYEDFMSAGWAFNPLSAASIASATPTGRNGAFALQVTFNGDWATAGFTRSVPLIPAGLRAVVFRVRGITDTDNGQVWLTLTTIGGQWIAAGPITDHMVTTQSGTYDPNTWYTVVLPMDELNPNGVYITGLSLMTGTLGSIYLDDMWLVAGMEFPLKRPGDGAYDTTISSVFDHTDSNTTYNCRDEWVVAYTGEVGHATNDVSAFARTVAVDEGPPECVGDVLQGYAQDTLQDHMPFSVGGQYDGGEGNKFLFYDGHTGYDYPAVNGTPVYAVSDGVVTSSSQSTVVVSHRTGYESHYLHLTTRNVAVGEEVVAGKTQIGTVGDTHLHFTMKLHSMRVDPYGWSGTFEDPSRSFVVNVPLWK